MLGVRELVEVYAHNSRPSHTGPPCHIQFYRALYIGRTALPVKRAIACGACFVVSGALYCTEREQEPNLADTPGDKAPPEQIDNLANVAADGPDQDQDMLLESLSIQDGPEGSRAFCQIDNFNRNVRLH
ncbi:Hypp2541 [Branchiostoma lanceolatum]|uniref:Hypp2541 protein n=1 Tax=Branchiostoma lanceolatum TaxID=7740 RepID=A0A8K0EQG6_BRALA|nr:Hypp2541 [Branchiostoma lanceolatum]